MRKVEVLRGEGGHLGDREDEDEVEEQLDEPDGLPLRRVQSPRGRRRLGSTR